MALKDITLAEIERDATPTGYSYFSTEVKGFSVFIKGSKRLGFSVNVLVMWDDISDAYVDTEIDIQCETVGEIKKNLMSEIKSLGMSAKVIGEAAKRISFYAGNLSTLNVLINSNVPLSTDDVRELQKMNYLVVEKALSKSCS